MNILLVDDDNLFAHMLAEKLHELEPTFQVVAVASAEAARQAVKEATMAFDVFLLDQRLDGSDVDGIAVMRELFRQNPDSDAIMLTGYDDPESGLDAFAAGAHRYLTKPFDVRELIAILKVLEKAQMSRRESNWLRVLSEIAVAVQQGDTVQKVGDILCQEARRLGFERARLWLIVDRHSTRETLTDDTEFEGISEAGHAEFVGFCGLRLPLRDLPNAQKVYASGKPGFFIGQLEQSGLDGHYGAYFKLPIGEWAKLPLFVEKRCIGFLVLDNADHAKALTPEQRRLLGLFGNQAAAALARAIEQEETQLLLEIGREITKQAAVSRLDDLLDTVREQVGRIMRTDNYTIVLLDEDEQYIEFRRHYERDELQPRHWLPYPSCISGDVIQKNETLLLPCGEDEYRKSHGMAACGDPSKCWLGVPLRLDNKAIGAIILQDYRKEYVYGAREERLLLAVADMAAGAIGLSFQAERNAQIHNYDESHSLLRFNMRRLVEEGEYWFWHAILTLITGQEGLGLNRAMLFLLDVTGTHLQGRIGIGYLNYKDIRDAWGQNGQNDWSFKEYLSRPQLTRGKSTALQEEITKWKLETIASGNTLVSVWELNQPAIMSPASLEGWFPEEFLHPSDMPDEYRASNYALVPVKSGDLVYGIVVVDNCVDARPIRRSDLQRLQTLLEEAAQASLGATENRPSQDIQELTWKIMGYASNKSLEACLQELCNRAKDVTGADYVLINRNVLRNGNYNSNLVSFSRGLRNEQAIRSNTPRQHDITFAVLETGTLAVPNVFDPKSFHGGQVLSDHDFVKREGVQAFIGVPMRSNRGRPMGVVYLDYRSPKRFSPHDILRSEQIANIGANLIAYKRSVEPQKYDRSESEVRERIWQSAMQYFSYIQAQALTPDIDETQVIRSILQNTAALFGRKVKVTLAMLNFRTDGGQTTRIRIDYHLDSTGNMIPKPVKDIYNGELGKAIKQSEGWSHFSPPRPPSNVLVASIRSISNSVGALLVRHHSDQRRFSATEREVLEELATVSALALDSVQARSQLRSLADTVANVSNSADLPNALQTVVDATRYYFPNLDCVTIWYRDPDKGYKLILGPSWGVRYRASRDERDASKDSLVRKMMERSQPLFVRSVREEVSLGGSDFIQQEDIVSTAVLPLRFGHSPDAFGVLFLNYRKPHEFPASETDFSENFGNAIASAIGNVLARQQVQLGNSRLRAALEVAESVGSELDLDRVLLEVLHTLKTHFNKSPAVDVQPYVMLYDEADDSLYLPEVAQEYSPVDQPEYSGGLRLHLDGRDKGVVCRVAREAMKAGSVLVMNFPEIRQESDYLEFNSKSTSLLCAGLVTRDNQSENCRLWGVLAVSTPAKSAFNEQDKQLLELAAQQTLIALERSEQAANLRFKDAVSSVTTWAAEVAHDVNTAVGAIRNRVDWLRDESGLSVQGLQWIDEIGASATRLADVARSARTDQQMDIQDFDLCQMLTSQTVGLIGQRWPKITVVKDFSPEKLVFKTYRERLWRGIRHLVRNAADAMKGEGELTIRTQIRGDDGGRVEIQIEDTGPGVPAELRGVLLEQPYSSKGELQDRGYGLLIARQLIESLGGSIRILPQEPNRGAVFAISLPLTPERLR